MEYPEDKQLEEFIHRQLKKLPERQAPEALIGNVIASLAARRELPWYKKPWSEWPRLNQNMFLVLLVAALSGVAWTAAAYTPEISTSAIAQKAQVSWIPEIVRRLFDSTVLVARSLKYEWIIGAVAALALCYLWCVAAGVALFRVLTQRRFTV
jgi:hypothetical protein